MVYQTHEHSPAPCWDSHKVETQEEQSFKDQCVAGSDMKTETNRRDAEKILMVQSLMESYCCMSSGKM